MTYSEAVQYLESFINYEKTTAFAYPEALKLDRMRGLLKELGNPQNAYEAVLIAGSNGKGSVASFLSSILRMENYRVGLYTSPHLLDIRERIQVNGLWIPERRFAEIAERLSGILRQSRWKKDPPTFFEVLTAMAFGHFKDFKVQIAVLEVGLGGLYDSTNVAPAKVVGITPISLEHTDKLGRTIQKIAVQKCGIVHDRAMVVAGLQEKEAESVIQDTCREQEAELVRLGKEIQFSERDFGEDCQRFDIRGQFGNAYDLETRLLGRHQIENAVQAVALAKCLEKKKRLRVSDSAICQGIVDARCHGRLEKVAQRPLVILDGAHNPQAARRLAEALERHFSFEKLILVVGVSQDKDLAGIAAALLPEAAVVIATQADNPRALSARLLAESVRQNARRVLVEEKAKGALEKARHLAGPGDLVLVTGSLYLVGEIKNGYPEF